MAKRDDVILAIAARKVKRTTRPPMPAPGKASIERMGQVSRSIAAFEHGEDVFDVVVDAELIGATAGTATLTVEAIMQDDLELTAGRAIVTIAGGICQQIVEANTPPDLPPPPGEGQG